MKPDFHKLSGYALEADVSVPLWMLSQEMQDHYRSQLLAPNGLASQSEGRSPFSGKSLSEYPQVSYERRVP